VLGSWRTGAQCRRGEDVAGFADEGGLVGDGSGGGGYFVLKLEYSSEGIVVERRRRWCVECSEY